MPSKITPETGKIENGKQKSYRGLHDAHPVLPLLLGAGVEGLRAHLLKRFKKPNNVSKKIKLSIAFSTNYFHFSSFAGNLDAGGDHGDAVHGGGVLIDESLHELLQPKTIKKQK